jgi:hypothetical protein
MAVVAVVAVVALSGFVVWASSTNPLMPQAVAALNDTDLVDVIEGRYISFEPRGQAPTVGYIFYPGGRVDYRAYAPYAQAIAAEGYLVVIVPAPLNLAFFNINAAAAVIADYPHIETWAVAGHSLGGVAASLFAEQNPSVVDALVLQASYPAGDTLRRSRADLPVLSLYATQDNLARPEQVLASSRDLPQNTRFVAIEGGNHAQFGYYGPQAGDGVALISHEQQQTLVVEATVRFLQSLGS